MKKGALITILIIFLATCSLAAHTQVQPFEEFNAEIPFHPKSKVVSIVKLNMPNGIHATLEIEGTSKEVLAYYKGTMANNGWAVQVERENFLALFKQGSGLMIDTENFKNNVIKATLVMANA